MRLRLLVLCAGIAAHSKMPDIPPAAEFFHTAMLFLMVLVLAVALSASIRRTQLADAESDAGARRPLLLIKHSACLCLLLVSGFLWAMLLAQLQLAQRLPAQLEGVDFWLTGQIEGLVRRESGDAQSPASSRNPRSQQFDLRVDHSCLRLLPEQCQQSEQNKMLTGQLVVLNDYAHLPVQSGERWQLRVRVNRPHGFSNPGAYDFEAGQFQRGIMARGYIRETAFNTQLEPRSGVRARLDFRSITGRLRAALAVDIERLTVSGKGLTNSGLIKALTVGDREGISGKQWDLFTATGTNHLVVISGLHVGFVALCAWTLVNWLSRRVPCLLLRIPAQHLAAFAAIGAAAGYSLMAGFSLSTQRALIMISVLMISRLSGRPVAPADSLCLAALIVLVRDPMAVTQAGFWLSFAAVASLFFAFAGHGSFDSRSAAPKPEWSTLLPQKLLPQQLWRRWVQPQWAVSVGLLLPLLLWTGQMSLNAPLANIFAVPLVSLLVVPAALIGVLLLSVDWPLTQWLASCLLLAADFLLQGLQIFLLWLGTWTPGLWRPAVPSFWAMILMALCSVLLLMPGGLVPRWLAVCMLLPLIWPSPAARPLPGRVWLQFLDVGQGLAVVVHTHKHNLLFDTGPALGPDFDAGRAVILPYLHQAHVSHLDSLIISHWHADHSGGLDTVVQQIPARQLLAGHTGRDTEPGFNSCEAGQQWAWDEVSFTVLFPPAGSLIGAGNINDSSCVLLIEAAGQRVLLTGDIEEAAERWLVREHRDNLAVNILQAPHHGSRSSSTSEFVQATGADWVIMSAGYRNRFGHPHADVVERYQYNGAQVLMTADSGAIWLELGGAEPQLLSRHRQQQRRFWFNL
ncbi:MAG: DNA internalization-related competence protein ComEC/Rec2 [Pseudohongiella sp.]|nr:DNA internalization-related competence protein ComEC/Rec2 [Pseudohongiella sp.]